LNIPTYAAAVRGTFRVHYRIKMLPQVIEVIETFEKIDYKALRQVAELLRSPNRNYIVTFGNGGSHSNASHLANDLTKACGKFTICLGDLISATSAYMNDEGRAFMYSKLIKNAYPIVPDMAVAFSCSGNSENVVEVLKEIRRPKVLFTGETGGEAQKYADITIKVPHPSIMVQESVHSVLCHALIEEING